MFQIKPRVHLIKKIEFNEEKQENSFEKAIIENERIQNKQELERRKLSEFNLKVKNRLILYKYAENRMNEDFKINFNLGKNSPKIKSINHIEAENKGKTNGDKPLDSEKIERSLSLTTVSTSDLPKFVIRSLIDEYESKKHLNDERTKRIASMRKIYSNIERDKIKKFNSVKDLTENKIKTNNQSYTILKKNSSTNLIISNNFEEKNVESNKLIDTKIEPLNKEKKKTKFQKEPIKDSEYDIELYIKHLKCILREKYAHLKQINLPTLCQCNISQFNLWDNDWSQCANNCTFYKNPKEYAKVLLSLINEKAKVESN